MRYAAYILAQATWGMPQTLVGGAVYLAHRKRPHFRYHGAVVTTWDSSKGLSLGPFIFLKGPAAGNCGPDDVETDLLVHEYGHTLQSIMFGPLYLVVVGVPSLIWLNVPALAKQRQRKQMSYYSFGPERHASMLGERILGNGLKACH